MTASAPTAAMLTLPGPRPSGAGRVVESGSPVDVEIRNDDVALGRRRTFVHIFLDRGGQANVPPGLLGQEPLQLEDVTVCLERVAVWADLGRQPRERWRQHIP